MRVAISNIAWDTCKDELVSSLLNEYGVDAIDIAPTKYFPKLSMATDRDVARVRNWWSDRGIEITGMQSLLYGAAGLNIFAAAEIQRSLLEHMTVICRIGGALGAKRLVFGSPKNRDRGNLSAVEAVEIAAAFFDKLGDIAESFGVGICLEPNPSCYGANFMTTTEETVEVVRQVAHSSILMQLDTGALTINEECIDTVLQNHAPLIGHIHASEPNLLPLGVGETKHSAIAAAVTRYLPDHIVSVEMVATPDSPLLSIRQSLHTAILHYRT